MTRCAVPTVVLDASALVSMHCADSIFHLQARRLVQRLRARGVGLAVLRCTLLETADGLAMQVPAHRAAESVERMMNDDDLVVFELDDELLREALSLRRRGRHRFLCPGDAVLLAFSRRIGAEAIVSFDARLRQHDVRMLPREVFLGSIRADTDVMAHFWMGDRIGSQSMMDPRSAPDEPVPPATSMVED